MSTVAPELSIDPADPVCSEKPLNDLDLRVSSSYETCVVQKTAPVASRSNTPCRPTLANSSSVAPAPAPIPTKSATVSRSSRNNCATGRFELARRKVARCKQTNTGRFTPSMLPRAAANSVSWPYLRAPQHSSERASKVGRFVPVRSTSVARSITPTMRSRAPTSWSKMARQPSC